MTGRTISHYRLLEILGRGGMGVVYKAEDCRLHRFVAIKLLSDEISHDPVAVSRFHREAQAASALNHPGICTVYDLGAADGCAFIAMEYLEGAALDRMIADGGLPYPTVIAISLEIVDALDAAHSKGILHRDIKPGNIFVTSRGPAKVLDFGIATAAAWASPTGEQTTLQRLTSAGDMIGTVAYMSPEQVRGEELDARSDLFSYGIVLYEMSTGVHPFGGTTPGVVVDAILNRPPAATASYRALPVRLAQIIGKCLEKDRALRYQSAADLLADLKRPTRDDDFARGIVHGRRHRPLIVATCVTMLVIAAVALWFRASTRREAFERYTIAQATNTGTAAFAAVSPDGRFIVNVQRTPGGPGLWLWNIATGSDTQIAPPQPLAYASVAFSPDGNYVYSRLTDGPSANVLNLYRTPVLGGARQLVSRDVDSNITFSPSGDRMTFARANYPTRGVMSIIVAAADGTNEETLITQPIATPYSSTPAWSPDGRLIAYVETYTSDALGKLTVFNLGSRQKRVVMSTTDMTLHNPQWSSDQRWLLVLYAPKSGGLTRRQIGAVSYPAGAFRSITNDTNDYVDLRLSADGHSLVSVLSKTTDSLEMLPGGGGPHTAATPFLESRQAIRGFTWTADGGILYPRENRLLLRTADGQERPVFVSDPGSPPTMPDVCRDDGSIVFIWPFRNGATTQNVWRINADGTEPRQLTDLPRAFGPACSPDGQWVAFQSSGQTFRVHKDGGAAEVLNPTTPVSNVAFSPDGTTAGVVVAIRVADTQRVERKLVLVTLATADRKVLEAVGEFAGGEIRFTPDGAGVAYSARANGADNIRIQPLDGSAPRLMTAFSNGRVVRFRWSPDGSKLAVLRERIESDVVLLRDGEAGRQ